MQQRQLGTYGPTISAIGIGAMSFSDFYGATNEAESHSILTAALDQGVTHIDTADVYGNGTSEAVIGSFLARQGGQKHGMFSIARRLESLPTKTLVNAILTTRLPICVRLLTTVWPVWVLIILICFTCIGVMLTHQLRTSLKRWQP